MGSPALQPRTSINGLSQPRVFPIKLSFGLSKVLESCYLSPSLLGLNLSPLCVDLGWMWIPSIFRPPL